MRLSYQWPISLSSACVCASEGVTADWGRGVVASGLGDVSVEGWYGMPISFISASICASESRLGTEVCVLSEDFGMVSDGGDISAERAIEENN